MFFAIVHMFLLEFLAWSGSYFRANPNMLSAKLVRIICPPVSIARLPPNTRRTLLPKPICSKLFERKSALIIKIIPEVRTVNLTSRPRSRLIYLKSVKNLGAMGRRPDWNAYTCVMVAKEIMLIPKNINVPVTIKV